jgi:hypothetical protein
MSASRALPFLIVTATIIGGSFVRAADPDGFQPRNGGK